MWWGAQKKKKTLSWGTLFKFFFFFYKLKSAWTQSTSHLISHSFFIATWKPAGWNPMGRAMSLKGAMGQLDFCILQKRAWCTEWCNNLPWNTQLVTARSRGSKGYSKGVLPPPSTTSNLSCLILVVTRMAAHELESWEGGGWGEEEESIR